MKQALIVAGCITGFIGLILILVLVPLHFSYIERQHIGFKKNTATNEVDTGTVYSAGTHAWGVSYAAVPFPSSYKFVSFRGTKALAVFTDAGEIEVEVAFYYRLNAKGLSQLYSDFGLAYENRVVAIAQAELRNAATNFTTRDYQEGRSIVADGLFTALAATLPQVAHVVLSRNLFFLEMIHLPEAILNKRVQVFNNTQLQLTQEYERLARQTRLTTDQNVSLALNQQVIIKQNASVVADRMRSVARAKTFATVQKESGAQIKAMIDSLGVALKNTTDALLKFNSLLDATNRPTVLAGVTTSFIRGSP